MASQPDFADIYRRAVTWAERESVRIVQTGVTLEPRGVQTARCVGVRQPEKVRVLFVPAVPFPDDPVLRAEAERVGMIAENTAGMTLDYGIFIRDDHRQSLKLLAHELRHVTQYESSGSIAVFMDHYLRELLHFGYGPGPFEVDAEVAALKYAYKSE
jgi:hypothetical protein